MRSSRDTRKALFPINTSTHCPSLELSEVRAKRFLESSPDLFVALAEREQDLQHPARLDRVEDTGRDPRRFVTRNDDTVVDLGRSDDRDSGRRDRVDEGLPGVREGSGAGSGRDDSFRAGVDSSFDEVEIGACERDGG